MTTPRKDAQALGLPRYYTGEPCKHGHDAERYTVSGVCVACQNPSMGAASKTKRSPIFVETEQLAIDAQAIANRLYAQGHVEQSKVVTATAQQLCKVVESMNKGLRTRELALFFGQRAGDPYYPAESYD